MTIAQRVRTTLLVFLITFVARTATGGVYIVPSDREMIQRAEAIVFGTVETADGRDGSSGIVTDVTIRVSEVLKGNLAPGSVILLEQGGTTATRGRFLSTATNYYPGERVLAFLSRTPDGASWTTYGMTLGKLTLVDSAMGPSLLMRGVRAEEVHGWDVEGRPFRDVPRDASAFLQYVRDEVANGNAKPRPVGASGRERPVDGDGTVAGGSGTGDSPLSATATGPISAMSHVLPSAYLMGKFRWARFDAGGSVTFRVTSSQPGYDYIGTAQRALAAWTNDPNSNVNYVYGGTGGGAFVEDGVNSIVYNQSSGVPSGAIAYAQVYADAQHTYKGETMWSLSEGDVIVRSGLTLSQTAFDEAVTHELGHTLGFRHSNEASPSTTAAVMNSSISGRYGANPQPWDREALAHVYGSGTTTTTQTFSDVPPTHPYYTPIETVARHQIVVGCGGGRYCPDDYVTRGQMPVYVLRAKYGSTYAPPAATGRIFADVPATLATAAYIEELYRMGITVGCGGGNYCPNNSITRQQMAVFLLGTKYGSAYRPPSAVGIFTDVPRTSGFAPWVEQVNREGIMTGCTSTAFCPHNPVTRAQMASHVVKTFNLQ